MVRVNEFGTYRLCEQRRLRRACASAQSRQNLRCSLIQAVSQEEPSDRKPDPWPLWMAGHAQLKIVMTECSKTQICLTGPKWSCFCSTCVFNLCELYIFLLSELIGPRQANLCLRAFRHDKFQLRMPSHSDGLWVWLSVYVIINFVVVHAFYRRSKTLQRLCFCYILSRRL